MAVAIDWLTRTGKLCSEKRQEFILTRTCSASACWSMRSSSPAERSDAQHGRRSVPHSNAPSITNGVYGRGAPASPASSPAPCAGSRRTGRRAMLDLWQTTARDLYEDQREVNGPWMRGLYRAQPTGPTPSEPWPRSPIPFHGRDRGRADGAHQYQPHAARAHPLRHHRARLRHLRPPTCSSRATSSSRPTSSMA